MLLRGSLLILLCSGSGPRLVAVVYGHLSDVLELTPLGLHHLNNSDVVTLLFSWWINFVDVFTIPMCSVHT